MKELLIEEKAKAYDEAIEKAKDCLKDGTITDTAISYIETIFPELKDFEDEEIRKGIIRCVEGNMPDNVFREKYIAWLEKHGEKIEPIEVFNTEFERQISLLIASTINKEYEYTEDFVKWVSNALLNYAKHEIEKQGSQNLANSAKTCKDEQPTDNVEPKFKVGDWVVVDDGRTGRIIECTKDFADVDLEFSCLSTRVTRIRSWTIQDAKDGDFLYVSTEEHSLWAIFKSIEEEKMCFYGYSMGGFLADGYVQLNNIEVVKPLPKLPHRERFIQKMKEACYEWDAEKKELKKIEQK